MENRIDQLVEAIEDRHSVRTYQSLEVSGKIIAMIQEYSEELTKSMGGAIRIGLLANGAQGTKVKLGTYGVIKGASNFIVGACKSGEYDQLKLGYALEKLVLFCTSLGLGTVWLGGTYKKSDFAAAIDLNEGEEIKIVIPFGYEADKKSMIAKLMGNNNKKRKEFGAIYFDGTAKTPLTPEKAGKYKEALQMMRMAPSAINQQPWRVIKEGNKIHFYATDLKAFHKLDLGIGLAHFHLLMEQQGIKGTFVKEKPEVEAPFSYLVSWIEA